MIEPVSRGIGGINLKLPDAKTISSMAAKNSIMAGEKDRSKKNEIFVDIIEDHMVTYGYNFVDIIEWLTFTNLGPYSSAWLYLSYHRGNFQAKQFRSDGHSWSKSL